MSRRICRYYSINRIIPINRGEKIQKLKGEKMRTQQEIEKMSQDSFINIKEINERMSRTNNANLIIDLAVMKAQYQAQYNILLEVLK